MATSRTRQWKWYENEPTGPARDRRVSRSPGRRSPMPIRRLRGRHRASRARRRCRDLGGYSLVHPFERTRRHAWRRRPPPPGRRTSGGLGLATPTPWPIAAWLARGDRPELAPARPSLEWEKAARGPTAALSLGRRMGPGPLNSHDQGPFDTLPVGRFPRAPAPLVCWMRPARSSNGPPRRRGEGRYLVKGGSWDDSGCGVCRPAARHGRPEHQAHPDRISPDRGMMRAAHVRLACHVILKVLGPIEEHRSRGSAQRQ